MTEYDEETEEHTDTVKKLVSRILELEDALVGLYEIAIIAMSDAYLASDSRTTAARAASSKVQELHDSRYNDDY